MPDLGLLLNSLRESWGTSHIYRENLAFINRRGVVDQMDEPHHAPKGNNLPDALVPVF